MRLQSRAAFLDRGDLPLQIRRCGARAGIIGVRLVHLAQVAVRALVGLLQLPFELGAREVAARVVHALDAGAIDRHQLAAVEVEFAAKPDEVAKHLPERVPVVAPEVRDRLEVGLEPAQQPDHFKIAVRLGLQAATRTDAVQVTVDVQLQLVRGIVARPSRPLGPHSLEASLDQVKPFDERIYEGNRIVRTNVVVNSVRKEQQLRTILT